jgi:hypothetical protein
MKSKVHSPKSKVRGQDGRANILLGAPAADVVLRLRSFRWRNCYAKRLECVQLAGAVARCGAARKREQAPRTPNASRISVAASPRCQVSVVAVGMELGL